MLLHLHVFCFLSSYFIWEQKKRANASLFKNILSYVFVQLDFFFSFYTVDSSGRTIFFFFSC